MYKELQTKVMWLTTHIITTKCLTIKSGVTGRIILK